MILKILWDNIVTIHNPIQHDQTKHVEIDRHVTQEKPRVGLVHNANFLTKWMSSSVFAVFSPLSYFSLFFLLHYFNFNYWTSNRSDLPTFSNKMQLPSLQISCNNITTRSLINSTSIKYDPDLTQNHWYKRHPLQTAHLL
jgi:hypothetical protein